jgi:hypothetical protein
LVGVVAVNHELGLVTLEATGDITLTAGAEGFVVALSVPAGSVGSATADIAVWLETEEAGLDLPDDVPSFCHVSNCSAVFAAMGTVEVLEVTEDATTASVTIRRWLAC